jgi:hypothetical protein
MKKTRSLHHKEIISFKSKDKMKREKFKRQYIYQRKKRLNKQNMLNNKMNKLKEIYIRN